MMSPSRCPVAGLLAVALLILSTSVGCRDLAEPGVASDTPPRQAEQLVFVYDRSVSIQDHELEHALDLTRQRISKLDHGDRIVALELLQQELDEDPKRWATEVPQREFRNQVVRGDSVARERFLQDARDYVGEFSQAEGREDIGGTDILSTLHLVSSELRARSGHRTTLFLFSDMLQANSLMNLEGLTRMPADNWVQAEADRGTLPDLMGLCVFLVGARFDTPSSQIVKEFWMEYFEKTGATLLDQNYTYRPVELPVPACV